MTDHHEADRGFVGSVPELYDRYLVPLIFEAYADDLVERIARTAEEPGRVLEVAAGSGIVTRAMAAGLPASTSITATDLNQPMLDHAASVGTARPVDWRQADVMALPFDDDTFDVVVCQFGVMFFPDRQAAYAEIARALRPGGTFIFNTWGPIEENEFAHEVEETLARVFPDDPPRFLSRTPHGYFDRATILADVAGAGFDSPEMNMLEVRSRASSPDIPAVAYCHGTPLRAEIEARDSSGLDTAVAASSAAIERRFGSSDLGSKISGFVVTATAP
jgi:SAM-dependent methyltransferase